MPPRIGWWPLPGKGLPADGDSADWDVPDFGKAEAAAPKKAPPPAPRPKRDEEASAPAPPGWSSEAEATYDELPREENLWDKGIGGKEAKAASDTRTEAIRGEVLGLPTMWAPKCVSVTCNKKEKLICTGCRRMRYCCRVQQRAHWPVHKLYCKKHAERPCGKCGKVMDVRSVRHAACCGEEWCETCSVFGATMPCPFCGDDAPSVDRAAVERLKKDPDETALEVTVRRCRAWLVPLMRLVELVARWRLEADPEDALALLHVASDDGAEDRKWVPSIDLEGLAIDVATWVDGFSAAVPVDLLRLVPDAAARTLSGGHPPGSPACDADLARRFKKAAVARLGAYVDGYSLALAGAAARSDQANEGIRLASLALRDACGAAMSDAMVRNLEKTVVVDAPPEPAAEARTRPPAGGNSTRKKK